MSKSSDHSAVNSADGALDDRHERSRSGNPSVRAFSDPDPWLPLGRPDEVADAIGFAVGGVEVLRSVDE